MLGSIHALHIVHFSFCCQRSKTQINKVAAITMRFICFNLFRVYLAAHWWGFHDSQSGLAHYEWWAGTQKGGDDVMEASKLHLTENAMRVLDVEMPIAKTIYITVRAFNRAGLWSDCTSDGFRIDDSPPIVKTPPTMDTSRGVIITGTQVKIRRLKINFF